MLSSRYIDTVVMSTWSMDRPAHELAADRRQSDIAEWIVYDAGSGRAPLDDWLQRYSPSRLLRKDGIGWLCIKLSGTAKRPPPNACQLNLALLVLQNSGKPVNLESLTTIAREHRATIGKWMIWTRTGEEVDDLWKTVAGGVVDGSIGPVCRSDVAAKVSPNDGSGQNVICVYNDDFADDEEVRELERTLRAAGIRKALRYKPDIYSQLGVYRNNRWGLRPTIYESLYDVERLCSDVTKY